MWYPIIRPALFALDPERAHRLALQALRIAGWRERSLRLETPIDLFGVQFPNRVGLAAGFDKNAVAVDGIGTPGLGFIEVGGITEANVSLLKSGKVKGVRFDTLEKLCAVLQCQPGDLFEYQPEGRGSIAADRRSGWR
jgi:DNA-binding Xre family transcriptional regulator